MKSTKIKAVIFDLDGVIVSTDDYHYKAWKSIFDDENIPFDRKVNERLRGVSRMESLEIGLEKAKKTYSQKEKEALAEKKNNIYKSLLENLSATEILPGAMKGLEKLKADGIKIAVASSSKNARFILSKIGLSDYFDAVVDGTEIKNSKPNPEVFLKAAEKLGISPENCMVVEDALAGIEAAKKGKMAATAVGFAATLDEPDYKIKTLSDLENLLPTIK